MSPLINSFQKYQTVINFKKLNNLKEPKFRRTRSGCLCCRQRKKKCDEIKPSCGSCLKKSILCEWPQKKQQMENSTECSKGYKIIQDCVTSFMQESEVFDDIFSNRMLSLIDNDFILDQFLDIESQSITLSDILLDSNKLITEHSFSSEQKRTHGIELLDKDLCCYNAFLEYIENLIQFSHCHPRISATDILSDFVATNKTVREAALACGASWLGYVDSSYEVIALEKYHNVIGLVIEELKDPKANYTDHIFVCVQLLQGLCVRNKTIGFNITLCAAHFSSSYAVIKRRFFRKTVPTIQTGKICHVSSLDRLLMENFLSFYPFNIMLCHSSKLKESVPSPFTFFERFFHVLEEPIEGFENEDVWANHPIIGIGLKAYEIATKACWVCRFLKLPISEEDLLTYFSLFVEASKELERLSKLLETPGLEDPKKECIYVTRTILYASLIILRKLCHYKDTTIESLKDAVDTLLEEEILIKNLCSRSRSSGWSLFIGASTSFAPHQKKSFSEMLQFQADQLHSSMCIKMLNYLNTVWNDENSDHNAGFEFLFDTTALDIISI